MGLERYVVDAVVLEGRSRREIARLHGISKNWIYQLIARSPPAGGCLTAKRGREGVCPRRLVASGCTVVTGRPRL
jgi:transposase